MVTVVGNLIPYIIYILFIILASIIVVTMGSTLLTLLIASAIIIVGYLISALAKYKIEGVITDERIEYIRMKAKATAFDGIIFVIAAYTFLNALLKEVGEESLHARIPASTHIGLLALLLLAFYSAAYLVYSRKAGGM